MRTPLRPLSRRGLLTGTLGSAALLTMGGSLARLRHQGRATDRGWLRQRGPLRHREETRLLQLAAVHGRGRQGRVQAAEPRRVHHEDRHPGDLHRGHQRQQRVLRQGAEPARRLPEHRPGHHRADRLDGGPDDPARLDPEAGPGEDPERAGQPASVAAQPPLRHGEPDLHPVAVRPRRAGLQRQRHQGDPDRRRTAHPPRPQGQGDRAQRDARHHGPAARLERARPGELHRRPVRRRAQQAQEGRRLRADPQVHRQRLRARPGQGRHRRVHRLVRRRHPTVRRGREGAGSSRRTRA